MIFTQLLNADIVIGVDEILCLLVACIPVQCFPDISFLCPSCNYISTICDLFVVYPAYLVDDGSVARGIVERARCSVTVVHSQT